MPLDQLMMYMGSMLQCSRGETMSDIDLTQYEGKHIVEVLQSEGAHPQQAIDLAASMENLSAMHFAR